ncbi:MULTISPECIES: fluoride efflux transporter CrcB [Herbiconiux]|uniref:Fluoride-specific ion channel FluC n=1 Tax=Herbiconiux flava TaxID=881268 RepID=A0A852SL90_9MICO|nr:fluoride efflux transporter CrcB [Herbiconiux flava]NQX34900.1 fluoride efflux transporter CrcB [Herbiconiux sp. VKM Ac-2851]NYD69531.1 CrcB protein [Herbiconiux flava]GLK16276.1 putative fluoride ion transporter CrcB [Herbiconiux flava]
MTPLLFLAVAAAGGVGAALRFVVDGVVRARIRSSYPVGVTIINVTGSFLLGLLTGLALGQLVSEQWLVVLGTGLLGGYTTFSTASFETVRLLQLRRPGAALANGLGMLVASVAVATLGLWLGTLPAA